MSGRTFGVGIVGFGFMGRVHASAWEQARRGGLPCEVRAICTRRPRLAGREARVHVLDTTPSLDIEALHWHEDADALFADPGIDIVSVCTPTDTHVRLAVNALLAGKHVLVEKPVAIRSEELRTLIEAAAATPKLCMPAMCMRFWPGWTWLREQVRTGSLGPVRSAVFRRLTEVPRWSRDFYGDEARSGGALYDLHVHDVDFLMWCFGRPAAVSSTGSRQHVTTLYGFDEGPGHVLAQGGWVDAPGFPFRMRFTVEFDAAVAEYDSARPHPLTLTRAGRRLDVALAGADAYAEQASHFVRVLSDAGTPLAADLADAVAVTGILEKEEESLERGATVATG